MYSKQHNISGTILNAIALTDVQVNEGYSVLLDRITLLDDVKTIAQEGDSVEVALFLRAVTANKNIKRQSRKIIVRK